MLNLCYKLVFRGTTTLMWDPCFKILHKKALAAIIDFNLREAFMPNFNGVRGSTIQDIHRVSSLTEDTHMYTRLTMKAIVRWVPQNLWVSLPKSHPIKFPNLPSVTPPFLSSLLSLPLSHASDTPIQSAVPPSSASLYRRRRAFLFALHNNHRRLPPLPP